MAQLATCPHCETELLLPALDIGSTKRGCPQCGESFDAKDVATRFVAEATPTGNDDAAEGFDPGNLKQTLPAYSGTTLAAFLRDAEQKTRGPGHAEEDPPHDDSELGSRQTVSDFDAPSFDPTPPEHGEFDDQGVGPVAQEDDDLVDFDREWGAEQPSLRDDLDESDHFGIPMEEETGPADDFESQFGKFTLPDDIPDLASEGHDSDFGADFKALDTGGTMNDFTVPDLDDMETTSVAGEEVPAAEEAPTYPAGEDAPVASAVPIPARTVARRRRSNGGSGMGTLIKIVLGGIVGIWLAYPIALWIAAHLLGRTEEPLALARYYPNVMLPERFQHGDVAKGPGNGQQFFAPPVETEEEPKVEPEVLPPVEPEGPSDRFDIPDQPEVVATPVVELKEVPKYNLTDLEQTTAESIKFANQLVDGSYSDPKLQSDKRRAYAKLARLAHVLACLDPSVSSHEVAEAARKVFPPLFADARNRAEISLICELWIPYNKRDHGGVLISGTPDEGVERGSVVEYQLQTPDGKSLTVLMPEKLDPEAYASAVSVGVVGEILYDAPVQVEGYTGDTKQAIWGAYLFPIGGP